MKNLICACVGHRPMDCHDEGWFHAGEYYGTLSIGEPDGSGRQRARVMVDCQRCGQEFIVARVYVPNLEESDNE